jgi:hypothetical protein
MHNNHLHHMYSQINNLKLGLYKKKQHVKYKLTIEFTLAL